MSEVSVFDVAKYFLECGSGRMTSMKLQKLCYYAQAWSLVWDGKPLFKAEFHAWVNGPVCVDLFRIHKGQYWVELKDLNEFGDTNNLDGEQIETCKSVQDSYGKFSGTQLSAITHQEKPWLDARKGLGDGESGTVVITKDSMKEFYSSLCDDDESKPVDNLEFASWMI